MNWCFDHLGENRRRQELTIELNYDKNEKDYYGDYDVEDGEAVIRIYMNVNKTIKDLISSVIHEYVHNLQPNSTYDKLYRRYGYKNHPHEKEARKIEEKFWAICWDDVKHKIDKIIDKS
jgi:hypothetical protein